MPRKLLPAIIKPSVCFLLGEDGKLHSYYEGGRYNAIGMCRDAELLFFKDGMTE
jgi:hypothetical protein